MSSPLAPTPDDSAATVEIVDQGTGRGTGLPDSTASNTARDRAAAASLYRIKDRAFEAAGRALRDGTPMTEYDLQQQMVGWLWRAAQFRLVFAATRR